MKKFFFNMLDAKHKILTLGFTNNVFTKLSAMACGLSLTPSVAASRVDHKSLKFAASVLTTGV